MYQELVSILAAIDIVQVDLSCHTLGPNTEEVERFGETEQYL